MVINKPLIAGISGDGLRDELRRQYGLLASDMPSRLVATVLAAALSAAFLEWKIVFLLGVLNIACDISSMHLMRRVDPETQVWRYRFCLALGFVTEIAYILPPAMMWHLESQFAKAFAVGMIVAGIMHVTTVRAIHLPVGILGLAAIIGLSLLYNCMYWLETQEYLHLAYSTFTIFVAVGYGFGVLLQTHKLHRKAATDRAEAQSANAAKTRFLAQVSHELRTPLNAILGLGHAELAMNPNPESKARMGILVQSAESLTLVLDDILDMSAIQSGAVHIRAAPTDPAGVITSAVALYQPMYAAKKLYLNTNISDGLPRTGLLDAQRLRQCLGNLLSNTLKYTVQGGVEIDAFYDAQDMLQITVTDTGPGIDPNERDLIFAPFHRGLALEAGTGLGLAISRALARQMGGDLVLVPTKHGARFQLSLLVKPLPAAAPDAAVIRPPQLDLTGLQVLVVDDVSTNRLVAATYLRIFGARVLDAASGEEALQVLRRESVDLILLDMNMPGLSGLETLTKIREIESSPARPVLAMTADATEAHRLGYLAAGLDGYVAKPMSPDSLAAAIAPHLGGPKAPQAGGPG